MGKLTGKKVAILVTDGFEQVELTGPKQALEDAGAITHIVSPKDDKVKGWDKTDWGKEFTVDVVLSNASANDYDALVLPGGQINPDKLRIENQAIAFIKAFNDQLKPIAAICHGPWTLIEAGLVSGRIITSYPSIQTDLKNAGAHWVDQEVVIDHGIITSRNPDDIPAFNEKIIEEIAKVSEVAHA
ncbi:MAG: type 1 glutamine amidotransferase domain-containing protein [Cyclobacteriaceae bacterium]